MEPRDTQGEQDIIGRRQLLTAAAAAGLVAAGGRVAFGQEKPGARKVWSNSKSGRRTAIVTDTQLNIGPFLAQEFARLNYDLVIGDVQEGLPEKLKALGANKVVVVDGITQEGDTSEAKPGQIQRLVDAAMKEFGGYDSVFIRTAVHFKDDIFNATADTLHKSYEQNCLAVMYALQAVLPPLVKAGRGQVVVQTSATGEKPHPGVMSYSVMRAAANMMCRCAALSVAAKGVCVNAVGTNFMNYPGFKDTIGPENVEKLLKRIPAGRLGETEEAAHFTLALLDGRNMYTTGNFFPIAGGFNNEGMPMF